MSEANPPAAAQHELVPELLDKLPQAILVLSEDGRITFWSSGAEALFGYTAVEMLGQRTDVLIPHPRSAAGEIAFLSEQARAAHELRGYETERLARDGRQISVLLNQSAIRASDGSLRSILQSMTDIGELRVLPGALERRIHQLSILKEIGEALYGTMNLDEVLHLILVGVTAGPGLGFNRAFLLLADEKGKRLEGRLAIGPSDPEEARRIWEDLAQTPLTLREMLSKYERSLAETNVTINRLVRELSVPVDDESSLLSKAIRVGAAVTLPAGDLSPLDQDLASRLGTTAFAIAPLSARGRTIGALLADNTITRRAIQPDDLEMLQLLATTASVAIDNSRLYAELERRLKSLEQARADARRSQQAVLRAERLSVIGEMAARVAHDIRNPLVAIGGFARALLARTQPDDPSRGPLGVIVEEVGRLENIVTKVLDHAKPATATSQAVQINRLIEEALKLLEGELKETGVQVALALDPGLPAIPADSDRIFEMVLNLLRNGMQAMAGGGVLSLLSLPAGDFVEIQISDNGPGVPEDIQDRIFAPFFTTKSSGSGLGLTIVDQIVREHHGTISLQTVAGAGATFTVKLPLIKDEPNHDEAPGG